MCEDPKAHVGEDCALRVKACFWALGLMIVELQDKELALAQAKPQLPLLKTRKIIVPTS